MINKKPTKLLWLGIIVFIILIGYVGIMVAHSFPDVSSGITFTADETQWIKELQHDANRHFEFYQLVVFHYQITEQKDNCYIVTGQTLFGIPLVRAQICDGSIQGIT